MLWHIFQKIGYTVSVPITDSQDYDLIVDKWCLTKGTSKDY